MTKSGAEGLAMFFLITGIIIATVREQMQGPLWVDRFALMMGIYGLCIGVYGVLKGDE